MTALAHPVPRLGRNRVIFKAASLVWHGGALCWGLALAASVDLEASEEFRVNEAVEQEQSSPDVAMNRNGEFVIAYDQLTVLDGRVYPGDLFVRLYDRHGQAGEPIRVNDTTPGNPPSAAVALHDEGHFVVAWNGTKPGAEPPAVSEIYARRYDRAGNPLSEEIQVNSFVSGAHVLPDLAMDPQGNFVITWMQYRVRGQQVDQDGSGMGVFAQRYDKNGEPVGDEFQVSTITEGNQRVSKIAADDLGNFVVAWNSPDGSDAEGNESSGIFARLFDSSGAPRDTEFQVNEHTAGDQFVGGVATDGAGRIAILWTGAGPEADGGGVYVRIFDANGTAVSGPMRIDPVNDQPVSSFPNAAMAMERQGNLVVTWENVADQSIVGRVFNSRGEALTEIFRVNTSDGFRLFSSAVALNEDGDLLVSWRSIGQDEPDSGGVFARLFDVAIPVAELQITRSGEKVIISWPASAAGFQLETAPSLDSGGVWSPVTNGVSTEGDRSVVTIDPGAGATFYRLGKP